MSYGTSLGITLPTVSTTVGPDYAEDINEALESIIDVLEAKVTPAGISISSDLNFKPSSTNYAATNVERVNFQNKSAAIGAVTYPYATYVVDGDLYFNDGTGHQIRMTTGGTVNVSTTGGITGSGYGSSGVEVNWSSGDSAYLFKTASAANSYAHLWCNNVRLSDLSDHYIALDAPSLSSTYTVTLPSAVPASSNSVVMATAANPTVWSYVTDVTLTSLTTTGAALVGTTFNVGGNTTLTGTLDVAGAVLTGTATTLTLSSNDSYVVAGTGRFKHGTQYKFFPANSLVYDDTINTSFNRTVDYVERSNLNSGTARSVYLAVPMEGGKKITAVRAYVEACSGASNPEIRMDVYTKTGTTLSASLGNSSTTGAGTATLAVTGLTITQNDSTTLSSNPSCVVELTLADHDGASQGDRVYLVQVAYEHV